MLNKLLQKSRNSKFDGGSTINSSRQTSQQQQYVSSPSFPLNTCSFSTKNSNDSQKTSIVGSTNSVSLVASSFASQPSQTNLKPAQNQPINNAKFTNLQSLTSNNNFSSSSSSENYIFSSSSAAKPVIPASSNTMITSFNSKPVQTTVLTGIPLQNTISSNAKSNCNNNSNLTSPDSLKTPPIQPLNLHTPQPTKLRQFEQPIYSAQRVAVNLNSKIDFLEPQCVSQNTTNGILQSSDSSIKNPNPSTESDYQTKIKGLENKIALLVSELDKQTVLSNSALQDNSMFRKKYQDLQNSTQKQPLQSSQLPNSNQPKKRSDSSCIQYDLDQVQVFEIQAENNKLKALIASSTQEAQSWRQKYELLDKQFESHDEALKQKITDQYEKEITALNLELSKYKSNTSLNNKSKKLTTSSIRTAGGTTTIPTSNVFKENTNSMINQNHMSQSMSNLNNNLSEDWHMNYCALKEEKDKIERNLKKKIESLEEQNAFLQNESQQTQQSNIILQQSQCSQQGMQKDAKTSNIKELNVYFSKNLQMN